MNEAVITTVARSAIGKAFKGSLRDTRPEEFAAPVLSALVERTPGIEASDVEDVLLGCAMPEGEQGMNIARQITLFAGFPHEVPAATINRFCSSGSQTIALAADQVKLGNAEVIIAGGVESMTLVPMGGNKMTADPALFKALPEAYWGMGATAEEVAKRYDISREDQDKFALGSHEKALAAIASGVFADEIVPMKVRKLERGSWQELDFDTDEGPRAGSSMAALGKLRGAFDPRGTVTAGNTSQMNDGAAAVVVMSKAKADELGLETLVFVRQWAVAGVAPEIMGMGPAAAVPKLLAKEGLEVGDIDLWEINEAFASQSLASVRELGIDEAKVNVNGGAIACGHPLGATGAVLSVKLIGEMRRRGVRYGVVTMCIGGGMGFAYLLENPAAR